MSPSLGFHLVSLLALLALGSCATADPAPAATRAGTQVARSLFGLAQEKLLVVAHRGDSAEFPENTLPAFASAIEKHADLVELDFHQSADGVLVVIHDDTVDRTTDAEKLLGRKKTKIAELPLAELKRLDAGAWKDPRFANTPLPTLAESLEEIRQGAEGRSTITMVEHKRGEPEKLLEILRNLRLVERVLVQSFDWEWLERIHALEPKLALAALSKEPITPEVLERLERSGAFMAHWDARVLKLSDIARLHAAGYLVCIYTADDELTWFGAAAAGVDAITTNKPGELREALPSTVGGG